MLYYYMKRNLLTPTKLVPFCCKFVESFQVFKMAKSKYEYVKKFETEDQILPNCWIVVRIDGRAFHKFTDKHNFVKPNDIRALDLMNRAAMVVMGEFKDILISYGQSDEYSFILRKDTELYNRRSSKIMTYINSLFSSSYVFHWGRYFGDVKLKYPPAFDSRVVLYPSDDNLKDYLSWRQADCHVNNLYNTTFWALVLKGGLTNFEAEKRLSGTVSSDKNEILFSEFSTNYNDEPVIFKKGTILLRKRVKHPEHNKTRQIILPLHEDLIQDKFWNEHWEILRIKPSQLYELPSKDTLTLDHLIREQLHIKNNFVDRNEA